MGRRRAANEGSIFQRKDGRWVTQVTHYDESGRRRLRPFYSKSEKEAVKRLTAARKSVDDGLPLPAD